MQEQVLINGIFYDKDKAVISIFDHGLLYGDGIYTTMRTYNRGLFFGEEYIKRMYQQAKIINIFIPHTEKQLKEQAEVLIKKNNFFETRIRITISSGSNMIGLQRGKLPLVIIVAEELQKPNREIYTKGVNIITVQTKRFMPAVKSLNQLPSVLALQAAKKRRAYDALLTDNNEIREATTANIFFIKNNVLYTPADQILYGVTRDITLSLAKQMMKVQVASIKKEHVYVADECFLTNTTKGIIPVTKIDGKKIGKGKPGEITTILRAKFLAFVDRSTQSEHEQ